MLNHFDSYKFIDLNYHVNPDSCECRYGVLEAGRIYQKLKGAVVLKSHLGATSIQATIAQSEGLPVFPSVVLSFANGGLHYRPVLQALKQYQAKFPSRLVVYLSGLVERMSENKTDTKPRIFLNLQKQVSNKLIDILKLSCDEPILLSTGYSPLKEVYSLIDSCIQFNVPALLINQPYEFDSIFRKEDLIQMNQCRILWHEQSAANFLKRSCNDQILKNVKQSIYTSSLGSLEDMDIPRWHDQTKDWFKTLGLSKEREQEITQINPSRLLAVS